MFLYTSLRCFHNVTLWGAENTIDHLPIEEILCLCFFVYSSSNSFVYCHPVWRTIFIAVVLIFLGNNDFPFLADSLNSYNLLNGIKPEK